MKAVYTLICLCFLGFNIQAQNAYPVIESTNTLFNENDSIFTINYSFSDSDNDMFNIDLLLTLDGGANYNSVLSNTTGDIGTDIDANGNKTISYQHSSKDISSVHLRLVISDNESIEIEDIVAEVDMARVQSFLEEVEGIRHRTAGVDHLAATKTLIETHLADNNLESMHSSFTYQGYEANNYTASQNGINNPLQEYLVGGHYDTVDESPGADDNGTAVAAMLEVSTILSKYNFNKSIRYVTWDLEEEGLKGSLDYVNNTLEEKQEIQGYLNFEMIGYYDDSPNSQTLPIGFDLLFPDVYNEISNNEFRGDFLTNVGNTDSSEDMMNDFESIAANYVPELKVISVAAPGTGAATPDLTRSDHAAFWSKGIPALMLTDGANFRNPYYHSPDDTSDKLDYEFMSNTIRASVAYLAEKAEITHDSYADLAIDSLVVNNSDDFSNFQLKIFPNPTMDEIIVDAYDLQNNTDKIYRIYDQQGNMITHGEHNFHYNGQLHVKFYGVPAGQYTFYIFDNSGKSSRKRFVVQ